MQLWPAKCAAGAVWLWREILQVGLSGVGKLFSPEVLAAMGEANERPIIMAMSNPISRLECTHASAQQHTGLFQPMNERQEQLERGGGVLVALHVCGTTLQQQQQH